MGACEIGLVLDSTLSRKEVEKKIAEEKEQDVHERGHNGYTGGWSTVNELIWSNKLYDCISEATDDCLNRADKREAIVCKAKDERTNGDKEVWVIVGWAAE